MTSRPLFIRVAESIVTFGPIDQLGCLSAACSVALRISSLDQVRNGPPDAVMMTLVTSSRRPAVNTWNSALCSESTGRTIAPVCLARRITSVPAQTSDSLLASASVAPRSIAASEGSRPATPVIAPMTMSAGRRAASATASEPAAASIFEPESSHFSSLWGAGSPTAAKPAPSSRASFASAAPFLCAVSASTVKRPFWRFRRSMVLEPMEPVAPRIVTPRTAAGLTFGRVPFGINSPKPEAARGCFEAPACETHHGCGCCCCQKPVEAVHQPAVARDEMAGILRAEVALDRGFEQIAGLRHYGEEARHKDQHRRDGDAHQLHRQYPGGDSAKRSAGGTRPSLLGADRRPQLRPAERT